MNETKLKHAVIVRAGKNSLHNHWLEGETPAFDLFVLAYEEIPPELTRLAKRAVLIPGKKVDGWRRFLDEYWAEIEEYDSVAFLDDDLLCSARELNRCFALGRQYGLKIWQPSLTLDSYFSHAITIHNPLFTLRYTNFVEMMCPFFTLKRLAEIRPIFDLGIELGVDQLWCDCGDGRYQSCAVIDAVSIKHTRKVGKLRADQGFVGEDDDYRTYLKRIQAQVGYRFAGAASFSGVLKNGVAVKSRLAMTALSLAPLVGLRRSINKGWFIRPIINHTARCLLVSDKPPERELSELRRVE